MPAGVPLQTLLKSKGQKATLELKGQGGSFATTTVAFGNPPQVFEAVIDIGASDTFVPGPQCAKNSSNCREGAAYNATASTTYSYDGRTIAVDRNDRYTVGVLTKDSVHVGAIEVKDQVFEQASDVARRIGSGKVHYDTVLGLSREAVQMRSSSLQTKGTFQLATEQAVLERNVFTLRLPGVDGYAGRLTLGWIDEQLTTGKAVARLPLINSSAASPRHYASGGWLVEAASLNLDWHGQEMAFHTLADHSAIFSTVEPFSKFPADFVQQLLDLLDADENGTVDCAEAKAAPELVISLPGTGASMHRLVVKPRDYIRSEPKRASVVEGRCYVPITPIEKSRDDPRQSITLGYLFLQRYYSIFDADERMVSLVEL